MSDILVSIEISMYPLTEKYIPVIDGFLTNLHRAKGLKVVTNSMSTQVFGKMEIVFPAIQKEIEKVYLDHGQCPFVIKVLNGDVSDMEIKDYK